MSYHEIFYADAVNAVNRLNGSRDGIEMGSYEESILALLKEHKAEFTGTMESAALIFMKRGFVCNWYSKVRSEQTKKGTI